MRNLGSIFEGMFDAGNEVDALGGKVSFLQMSNWMMKMDNLGDFEEVVSGINKKIADDLGYNTIIQIQDMIKALPELCVEQYPVLGQVLSVKNNPVRPSEKRGLIEAYNNVKTQFDILSIIESDPKLRKLKNNIHRISFVDIKTPDFVLGLFLDKKNNPEISEWVSDLQQTLPQNVFVSNYQNDDIISIEGR